MTKGFAFGLTLVSLALPAAAHHGPTTSPTLYETDNLVQLEGEITGVLWRNPHVRFRLGVVDENGETAVWELETTVPSLLERAGVPKDLINVGDRVKAAGYPSRFRARSLGLRNLLLPDGREYAGTRTDLLWSTRRVDRVQLEIDESVAQAASEAAAGIYRIWTRWPGIAFEGPVRGGGTGSADDGYDHLLTDEARVIKAAYDPANHPVLKCAARGMPELMLTPAPMEIVAGDDRIIIHTIWPDPPRTIHMGEDAGDLPATTSHLGHSIGRWEDENTLVVTTTNVDWPYFDRAGTPQSDQISFVEHFIMTEDRSRLDYLATATDPVMFTAPVELTYAWTWLAGERIPANDCVEWEDEARRANPEASARLEAGVWAADGPPGTSAIDYPLTSLGQERLASFRLDKDPSLQCIPPGMPRGFSPRSPMDFGFDGDTLTIRYETMDVVRTAQLDGAPLPADAPHTPNGHAIGRWDGDTLVVETTHLTAGEVTRNGVPKSEAMVLRETFAVEDRDDGAYLVINMTITDLENFTRPFTITERFRLRPDWELLPFECHPTEY